MPRATLDRTGIRNMQQLVQLRWIAVVGQLATLLVVHHGLGFTLPLVPMLAALAGLAVFNAASAFWWRRQRRASEQALLLALLVDVASLTLQLHLAGGVTNPFVFLYVLQVALGTLLLSPASSAVVAAATVACFLGLMAVPSAVQIPMSARAGIREPYLQGLLLCFVLVAWLTVLFVGRIARILRERDRRLAALRRRAVEEEHIVRMGLLASGAAHELGTPLSTLSVILGDWRHAPHVRDEPELIREVADMQAQVERCKSIVSRILLLAGETRGEAPGATTLGVFLDDTVAQWRDVHPTAPLEVAVAADPRRVIVADTGLQQMLWNVLDNAVEASPEWVRLEVHERDGRLLLDVLDAGPGFDPDVIAHLGTPYNSTKGRPGGGLGLFLAANVARSLGGRLRVGARAGGGARVRISLPLSAIAIGAERDE